MCCRKNLYEAYTAPGRRGQVLPLAKPLRSHLVSCTHEHRFPFWCSRHTFCVLNFSSTVGEVFFCMRWCHCQFCTWVHSKTDSLGMCKRHLCSRAKVALPEIHPQRSERAQVSHIQTLSSQLSEQNTSPLQKIRPALSSNLESENSAF